MFEDYLDLAALNREQVLPHLVARRAVENRDDVFVQIADGPSLTYAEAHEESLRWASVLGQLGVGPADAVAVQIPLCLSSVTTWLGVAWLRASEVPINNDYRGRMLGHILASSKAKVLVIAEQFLDRLPELMAGLPDLEVVLVLDSAGALPNLGVAVHRAEDLIARAEPATGLDGPDATDVGAILYTSGTTGASKGVICPWAHILATFQNEVWDVLGPTSHQYSPFAMNHLSGIGCTYQAALRGASVVFKQRWSITDFWDDIRRYRCEFTWLVGSMPSIIWSQPERPNDADNSLKYALMAPVLPNYREFEARFGVKLSTAYGMTELSLPIVSEWDLPNHRSCGRVRKGYQVRIVDERDVPVPTGEVGEIIIRSTTPWTLNLGYLGMPEQTAEAWRHGWFHTGDGAWQDHEGNLYFSDRIKDAIRRRGENISSMEVEAEVVAHPDVAECAAIGVPSEHGEEEVFVFVVPVAGADLDMGQLSSFLVERMTRFMVPRYVQVVSELPRTPTLRVRKVELRKLADVGGAAWDREAVPQVQPAGG